MCCKSVVSTVSLGSIPAELLIHYVRINPVQSMVQIGTTVLVESGVSGESQCLEGGKSVDCREFNKSVASDL